METDEHFEASWWGPDAEEFRDPCVKAFTMLKYKIVSYSNYTSQMKYSPLGTKQENQ